jgi:3-phosphoshikimate 1-carboxyvinyltransferase
VRLRPARVDSLGDHRLAMAWAVAASLADAGAGETEITGAECVAVSYPGFFDELGKLS